MDIKSKNDDLLKAIKEEYEGKLPSLWALFLGQHLHTGGLYSSQGLAVKAGITPNMVGVELGCNHGASLRFLVKSCGVKQMTGSNSTNIICLVPSVYCPLYIKHIEKG